MAWVVSIHATGHPAYLTACGVELQRIKGACRRYRALAVSCSDALGRP